MTTSTPKNTPPLTAIGLMSGTSVDAIDGAILKTDGETMTRENIHRSHAWDDATRRDIFAVMRQPERLADTDFRADLESRIAARHAELVLEMLSAYGEKIDIIGFHGQTILHAPRQKNSVQLGCAQSLAEQTNLPVAHQFRQNDLKHGGEGAPLAPIFHAALMPHLGRTPPLAIANIGGITNITFIGTDTLIGCDTGVGNAMMDRLMQAEGGADFDRDGALAASGRIDADYLEAVLADDWYALPPPKSLDRLEVERMLMPEKLAALPLADALASLVEVCAITLRDTLARLPQPPRELLIWGGGARNGHLVERIAHHISCPLRLDVLDGDFIEAEMMAFLGVRVFYGKILTLPTTTGVDAPQSGGRIAYPQGSVKKC